MNEGAVKCKGARDELTLVSSLESLGRWADRLTRARW